jgi:beta-lactamase class A
MKIISKKSLFTVAILFLFSVSVFAQTKSPKAEIDAIIRSSKGTVSVGLMDLSGGKTYLFNKNAKLPMQSVFKFPLAMAVLAEVDKGRFALDQKILVTKKDLLPQTWSPIREKYPEGNVEIPLSEILAYTVSQSDNNGCDILFRLLGGTANVENYVRRLGVKDIAIRATEEEMSKAWEVQFTNWSKPAAMLKLLEIFNRGDKLSKPSSDFLWKIMTETTTGPNRLKGLLPNGTSVAHKTGTSGTNAQKVTGAINDVGIVTLPSGKKYAIVVFVANSTDSIETSEKIIARISKAAWDFYAE